MQERRQHLSRTCASHRQGESDQKRYEAGDKRLSQSLKKDSFLVDHKRRLIYCWNHKVASSFWMWLFTKLGTGKGPEVVNGQPGQVYKIKWQMAPRSDGELLQAAKDYTSILLVRPPLARLISAYRDRVAGNKLKSQFYTNVARVLGLEWDDSEGPYWEVTWPQFVAYLLKTSPEKDDQHWKSYTDQCSPCLINFTYIVHLEKDGEESWVLKKTDLSQVVGNTTRLMNPTSGGRSSESEVLETYLGMLDCDTVKRLFDRYYGDFVLFDYSLEEVLTLANNAPCTDLPR